MHFKENDKVRVTRRADGNETSITGRVVEVDNFGFRILDVPGYMTLSEWRVELLESYVEPHRNTVPGVYRNRRIAESPHARTYTLASDGFWYEKSKKLEASDQERLTAHKDLVRLVPETKEGQ